MDSIFGNRFNITHSSYSGLFQDLLKEIDQCMLADVPELEKFQNCFWVAVRHYKNLEQLVLSGGFASERQEIEFFREIKPKFTCFIEFFVLSSEALWFVNNRTVCFCFFWKEEEKKYKRFCKKYSSFICYYENDEERMEREYFLRTKAGEIKAIHSKIVNEHPSLRSSKDWLVRSYLANKMYFRFVKDRVRILATSQNFAGSCQHHKQGAITAEVQNTATLPASFSQLLLQYINWLEPRSNCHKDFLHKQ